MTDLKVVKFSEFTKLPIEADSVLEHNIGQWEHVALIGTDLDGNIQYASSMGDKATLIYWIEQFKYELLSGKL